MTAIRGFIRFYLKLFICSAIFLGSAIFIFSIYIIGHGRNTSNTIIISIGAFSLVFIVPLIMTGMFILNMRAMGYKINRITDDSFKVNQHREISSQLSYDEAFDMCVSSIRAVKNGRLVSEDRNVGRIEALIDRNSVFGNGDRIVFEIHGQKDRSIIILTCKPKVNSFVLTDYGMHFDSAEKIMGYIKNHTGPTSA